METELEQTISFSQVISLIKRNLVLMVLCVLLASSLGLLLTEYIPKKYKSKAVLSIQSSYFQHPLVSDVVSDIQDPSEMSSQRLSLLSHQFTTFDAVLLLVSFDVVTLTRSALTTHQGPLI